MLKLVPEQGYISLQNLCLFHLSSSYHTTFALNKGTDFGFTKGGITGGKTWVLGFSFLRGCIVSNVGKGTEFRKEKNEANSIMSGESVNIRLLNIWLTVSIGHFRKLAVYQLYSFTISCLDGFKTKIMKDPAQVKEGTFHFILFNCFLIASLPPFIHQILILRHLSPMQLHVVLLPRTVLVLSWVQLFQVANDWAELLDHLHRWVARSGDLEWFGYAEVSRHRCQCRACPSNPPFFVPGVDAPTSIVERPPWLFLGI